MFTVILFFIASCEKEEEPCVGLPCGNTEEYYGNRVARDPVFRLGTWYNINEGSSNDTIIFHNDSIWSNYIRDNDGNITGIFNAKYEFEYVYLKSYKNYGGIDLEVPLKWQTRYNDTTGVFSIVKQTSLQIGGEIWFDIEHYIKIK
jgi:hypothetical protein